MARNISTYLISKGTNMRRKAFNAVPPRPRILTYKRAHGFARIERLVALYGATRYEYTMRDYINISQSSIRRLLRLCNVDSADRGFYALIFEVGAR